MQPAIMARVLPMTMMDADISDARPGKITGHEGRDRICDRIRSRRDHHRRARRRLLRCCPTSANAPIWKLEAALKCRSCKKGRYAPPVHMINLTQEREIAPYLWTHPDDDDRR
jgi:hypothetical protein